MAWWKTLFESSEEAAAKAAEAKKRAAEMEEHDFYTSPSASRSVSSWSSPGTTTFMDGELNGVSIPLLMELAKLAKALELKTAEDVKKHFGEFYGESYATTTIKYGGIKLK